MQLRREPGGPDASFSMDEKHFGRMVEDIRIAEQSIGVVSYELTDKMKSGREFCRSLYVAEDMKVGDIITEENVRSVRPGYGLHPKYIKELIGRKMKRQVSKGDRVTFDIFE